MLTIRQRELNLKHNGYYYTGAIDDAEGPLLKRAYGDFQEDHDLEVDRIYGPLTDAECIRQAKRLQERLNAHGANLKVDGEIGLQTIAAIEEFQRKHGLAVDGIAGVNTWKLLNKEPKNPWEDIKYFKREEFRCDCGGKYCNGFPAEPNIKLVKILDQLRKEKGKPINITSGIRCKKYNDSLKGSSPTSAHMDGDAADFNIYGVTEKPAERVRIKKRLYELGVYYTYSDTPGMGIAIHAEV